MIIDLRSDTVTKPSKEMLEAMMNAPLGDDVFEEDPTVLKLESKIAAYFGMEAGLFCPSGTMTNQIGIKLHTKPGDEVICDRASHVYNYEGGGIAVNSAASVRLIHGDRGMFTAKDILANINNPNDVHLPLTTLVCVENTSNRGGGCCYDFDELQKMGNVCKEKGLKFHLDGARLFNAIIAKRDDPKQYGNVFDTISICLSKGMGAPIGSVLIGNKTDIKTARRIRKLLGGGMRQVGILAAAGIYALENNVARMEDDHSRAKILGEKVAMLSEVKNVLPVETNIVVFVLQDNVDRDAYISKLAAKGILAVAFGPQMVRFVIHLDITDNQFEYLLNNL